MRRSSERPTPKRGSKRPSNSARTWLKPRRTVRELNRTPRNGSLKSYNKPELLDLAASMGVEGRTNMTKDELVEVITKAARGAGWQAMRLFSRKSESERFSNRSATRSMR